MSDNVIVATIQEESLQIEFTEAAFLNMARPVLV